MTDSAKQLPPAGWYDQGDGRRQWFDGQEWSGVYESAAAAPAAEPSSEPERDDRHDGWYLKEPVKQSRGPMTHSKLDVERKVSYVRQQTPHSLTKHLLFGWMLLWIPSIYFAVSPNHYYRF